MRFVHPLQIAWVVATSDQRFGDVTTMLQRPFLARAPQPVRARPVSGAHKEAP
jgi:hypothetical protein